VRLHQVVAIMVSTLAVSVSGSAAPLEQFELGNQYYEQRDYDSAIIIYRQLIDEGLESAPLYFNLGNACFRSGDLGYAVLYYLRARRLDPADPDIVANVDFASRFTSVQMEGVELNPVSSLFEELVSPYSLSALAWISSAFFLSLFAFLIARYGYAFHGPVVRLGIWLSLVLLVAASLLTTVKYDHDYLTRRAVIIGEEAIVYTGPSELSDKELDAGPGLIVEIVSESGDFYNVLFENKRRGWIQKDLVAVV